MLKKVFLLSNFTFITCVPKAKNDAAMQTKETRAPVKIQM